MILVFVRICPIGLFLGLALAAFAQDYLQWQGPQRDGAASDFVAPKNWPEKLTRRWTVEVGEGYGTPLVIGPRVYVFTRRAGQEVLLALDANTGKVVWQSGYAAPGLPAGSAAAAHGDGPKATPLFHRGKLYTLGLGGILSAFDAATGKRRLTRSRHCVASERKKQVVLTNDCAGVVTICSRHFFSGETMSNIVHVTPFLLVPDLDAALDFFTRVLGFTAPFQMDNYAYLALDTAGLRVLAERSFTPCPFGVAA